MFEDLSDRIGSTLDQLTRRGALKEDDIDVALREVRMTLLEADVSLSIVRNFIKTIGSNYSPIRIVKSPRKFW